MKIFINRKKVFDEKLEEIHIVKKKDKIYNIQTIRKSSLSYKELIIMAILSIFAILLLVVPPIYYILHGLFEQGILIGISLWLAIVLIAASIILYKKLD